VKLLGVIPGITLKGFVAPQDPVTGCIEWTGSRTKAKDKKKGYGQINRGGKSLLTHRLAWELKHGPIPPGMKVCHSCDNPPCCNDEHLFLGTQTDNMADRDTKGRTAKGETHYRAKVSDKDVLEIRRRAAVGERQRVIAADFGIHQSQVSYIKNGKKRLLT
jgi:hypothetical protein